VFGAARTSIYPQRGERLHFTVIIKTFKLAPFSHIQMEISLHLPDTEAKICDKERSEYDEGLYA
jgi:hypothetical protein